jgi:hypothetical protein
MLGWLQQKIYPRLLPIGVVVWTFAAFIICALDGKSLGVGVFVSLNNLHLGLSSLRKNRKIHINFLDHNISMHCGALFLLLIIFMGFRSSVFVPFIY